MARSPTLSQAHHRGESLVPVIRRATSLLTGVGWPAFALTALLGKDIIVALYGEKWLDCVPAILPLTIAAGVAMLFHYSPTAFTAIGRPYLGAVPVFVTLFSRLGFGVLLFDGSLDKFAWAICLATIAGDAGHGLPTTPLFWLPHPRPGRHGTRQ